jgi:hypothetical protein
MPRGRSKCTNCTHWEAFVPVSALARTAVPRIFLTCSLGWIHTGFGGIGTWEEWFGGTAGKGAGGMASGPGGWVMVSPRFGESSVRMAQRCIGSSEHAGNGCAIVMSTKSSEADGGRASPVRTIDRFFPRRTLRRPRVAA